MTSASSKRVHEVPEIGKETFKSEFAHLTIGTCLIDGHNRFICANHAFSAMLGYSERQLLKMNVGQITHAQDLKVNTLYKRRLQKGSDESVTFEKRFIH